MINDTRVFVGLWLAGMSLVAFILFGIDKKRARKGQWRISERMLLCVCFLGGGIGGMLGMQYFHHKTRHAKFVILVPISIMLSILIAFTFCKHVQ